MISTAFFGAIIMSVMRLLSEDFFSFQLVFFYNATAFICMIPWVISVGINGLKTTRFKLYSIRSLLEMMGWSMAFYAITLLPLPVYASLNFMTPLLMSTAAVMLLKEQTSRYTWTAMLLGFVGVLIIIRPTPSEHINLLGAGLMLLTASCFSLCGIIIRRILDTDPNQRIVFYMLLLTSLFSLPFALLDWHNPELQHVPWLSLLGVSVYAQQYSVTMAFSKAKLTTVLPFTFTHLIFVSIIAYFAFDELVDIWTIIGAIVILRGALYAVRHARQDSRE